jgi:hypothetical protein
MPRFVMQFLALIRIGCRARPQTIRLINGSQFPVKKLNLWDCAKILSRTSPGQANPRIMRTSRRSTRA